MEIDEIIMYVIIVTLSILSITLVLYIVISMLYDYKNKNINYIEDINNKLHDDDETVVDINCRIQYYKLKKHFTFVY